MARKSRTDFEILPAHKLRAKYSLTAESRPVILLDPTKVPIILHALIPLAERFGIGDDLIRADVVEKSSIEEIASMRAAVDQYADAFDEWLAGPEAKGPQYSQEYVAFSCLRMAADGC